jgi:hypothetical protein
VITVALPELGFGAGLTRHLMNYEQSSLLGFRCQPPFYWRASPISTRPITPLWECGTTLVYFNRETKFFEKCSLEDIDDTWVKYRSAQAISADLFIELYEDEFSDEELKCAAEILGFKHIERFLEEVETNHGPLYDQWAKSFPSTCEC